ncbi:hypothetical protein [Gilliamella sp. Imp1-1]|uniref:hypothetical protein n=1 Tax=Gilliamella sp. Imp1-1 TaxID=3120248 RepID=UPI00080EA065|nr:hypothetical protein [Gilliamella apicola]OCG57118.1 hypothetical protein A9G38_00905 [Gilliamella apicola]
MHYHLRHRQTYVLNLLNNLIRRVFTRNLFISSKLSLKALSKLSLKSPKTALLVLALLLLSSSWDVQANGKKARAGNRSDAIIIPSAVINYVRPNLFWGNGKYAGPADIWNQNKGFLVQSVNPESYNQNFPTTGAYNLYFDLLITGIEPEELTWEPVTHEGITATVTNVVAREWWIPYEDLEQVVARVKLTGPEARNQWDNPNPRRITVPRLPQTFELVGRDRDGVEVVKYGFVLRQWFVSRWQDLWGDIFSNQTKWCNSLSYRLPQVRDLTNAKCGMYTSFPCINGIDNVTSSSSDNIHQRRIGNGFFTEWGPITYYADAGFANTYFWTSDVGAYRGDQFLVSSGGGNVISSGASYRYYTVCTAP